MENYFVPPFIKNIGQRIDLLRSQKDFSLRDLEKRTGISKSELSYIILGKTAPNLYTLSCICDALEITLSSLLDPEEKNFTRNAKEALLLKIFREISPMSQDTLIKVSKCMK